ncbi:MAG: peptidoglycan-binding domain-containing protein [Terriglobia bacterium]
MAVNGLYGAEHSTASVGQKPAARTSTASTHPTPTVLKKAATRSRTSNSSTHVRATPHSGSVHSAARRPNSHVSSASAAKTPPAHASTYASQHKSATTRNQRSGRARTRALTGRERLARIHLQPERAQEIQQALIREGYLQGDANGEWDSRTRNAMQRYQTEHGFPATGLPEAKSLMKLGLGSHPLPSELDHSQVGAANPAAPPGDLSATPASPPISQVTPW